ncbi:unnamed protein product [Danaus chrysippus]|uniref:(African queen) hypothetical protein n=1 Tax=Danaus chrysippus TaxID=151541 RepID=A0A8J2QIB4_9NEOP|nr:unnamed protein product [Danaus chrysippus]
MEVIGPQRLLDLLLRAPRRRLHRAAEAVQHTLESELLHRECCVARILCPAAATSQPSAPDSEPVLAAAVGGRSLAPAPRVRYCAGPPGPPPTPTRAHRHDDRRKLGEAPPPECTAMRSAGGSIRGAAHERTPATRPPRPATTSTRHTARRGLATGERRAERAPDRSHRTCYGKR